MTEIFVGEEHVQVLDLWHERGDRDVAVSHVDFHCDMRGLLVDRRRDRAWRIDGWDPRSSQPDSGNFLGHAITEGIVRSVRWIHDPFGGRRHDTGTVKYETDLTALPHRLLHRFRHEPEVDVHVEDLTFAEWDGVREGEHFDIDWDGIASIDYDTEKARALMADVLERDHPSQPRDVYLIYSPGYSNPDRSLFEEFLDGLQAKWDARVTQLPAYAGPPHHVGPRPLRRRLSRAVELGLRRCGVF